MVIVQCSVLCCVDVDRLLYELGKEVGCDWKELALSLGMPSQDLDSIDMEGSTPMERAWMMLQLVHSKTRREFAVAGIRQKLAEVRKEQLAKKQQSKSIVL